MELYFVIGTPEWIPWEGNLWNLDPIDSNLFKIFLIDITPRDNDVYACFNGFIKTIS